MIDKNELKQWFAEGEKRRSESLIEEYIDECIKENALNNNTTFTIYTYEQNSDNNIKTSFHDKWFTPELSKRERYQVQERIINKYRENGYSVERCFVESTSKGKSQGLRFFDIDKVVK